MSIFDIFKAKDKTESKRAISSENCPFGEPVFGHIGRRKALSIPAVYAAVSNVADTLSTLELPVYAWDDQNGPQIDYTHPVYQLLNIAPNPLQTAKAYAPWNDKVDKTGAVNSDTYLGFAPNTLKITGYEIESVFEQNLYYFQISVTFLIGDPDWDVRVLDCGTFEYLGPSKPSEKIKDSQGNFVPDPVPLDGNGRKLALGSPLIYLLFKDSKQRAFSTLFTP